MRTSAGGRRAPIGRAGLVTPAVLAAMASLAASAVGQTQRRTPDVAGFRGGEAAIHLERVDVMRVTRHGLVNGPWAPPGPATDACNVASTHAGTPFTGGSYLLQQGFGQTELAAASYTVAASEFPVKIILAEALIGTLNASTQTVTRWSLLFYSGTPDNGTLIETYSSDDLVLPHARVGPGTAGLNIQFAIDPGDPEQLFIPNNGSNTFTVALRIDQHHQQTQNPCFTAPPTCCNAFPMVDCCAACPGCAPNFPANNWLGGINCGFGGFNCPPNPSGSPAPIIWGAFSGLGACRPSGDWMIRATWSGVNCTPGVGACCKTDGTCQIMLATECATISGTYRGDGSDCATANCPQPVGACCFSNGNCLSRNATDCASLSGTWLGAGTVCNGTLCPTGACCFPSGSCTPGLTQPACIAQGGVFQTVGSTCGTVNCPQPVGACCTASGCSQQTEGDCLIAGGNFRGLGTSCATACVGACCTPGGCSSQTQGDCGIAGGTFGGVGSSCPCAAPCYANCDASTATPVLNVADFTCFLTRFAAQDAYANCDASTSVPTLNVADFTCFLQKYAGGCP